MDWPELHSFLAEVEKSTAALSANARKERLQQKEHLVCNLAITVILVTALNVDSYPGRILYRSGVERRKGSSYLMLATGGVASIDHSNPSSLLEGCVF